MSDTICLNYELREKLILLFLWANWKLIQNEYNHGIHRGGK